MLFSFSSIQLIRNCPRRWQLIHSKWGEYDRFPERPHPSAIEGQIVHEALDRLARAVGRYGYPPIGSPMFQAAVESCGFWEFFSKQIDEWNACFAVHTHIGPSYVLQTNPRYLANQAICLFRERYQSRQSHSISEKSLLATTDTTNDSSLLSVLHKKGALSEQRLEHPSLPLIGILDLVILDDTGFAIIIDFKTGMRKASHEEQLRLYALLWWRVTNELPIKTIVQYLDTSCESTPSEIDLITIEEIMGKEIALTNEVLAQKPASARISQDCLFCPVRPRCDEGWSFCQKTAPSSYDQTRQIDLEITIMSKPTPTGFLGTRPNGEEVSIVYDTAIGNSLSILKQGCHFRVVDAIKRVNSEEVEVLPWTQIYFL
ncbi:MAG: PD-(D/E)XK nuclease family protein [Acidobacteriota bacterium]